MTASWEFTEPGDTHVYLPDIPGNSGPGGSSLWCGCTPEQECPSCNGTAAEERAVRRDAIAEVRRQWRAGELTPHAYYWRSLAVAGLPDQAAVRAMDRVGWPGPAGATPERAA